MNHVDKLYLEGAKEIITRGDYQYNERTGQGTFARFGMQQRHNLENNTFPLLTNKKMYTKGITHELLWFINGDTNIKYLVDNNVGIWNDWPYKSFKDSQEYSGESMHEFVQRIKKDETFAQEFGELGPVYGKQWRSWQAHDKKSIDQLKKVVDEIKRIPGDRGHIISAWNVGDLDAMALRPCHCLFQFNVADENLSCQLYQRSADWLLGVPFNIASYAMFTKLIANETQNNASEFIHTFGNAHIYLAKGKRGEWYNENKEEFKDRFTQAQDPLDFITMREWVMQEAPIELREKQTKQGIRYALDDHIPFLLTQFSRTPRKQPHLEIKENKGVFDVTIDDITLKEYDPHPVLDFEYNGKIFTPGIAV